MELRSNISDIEDIVRIITECKRLGVELTILVTMKNEHGIATRKRELRKMIIQDILINQSEGLTVMQLLRKYNHGRRKINRKTILRDCFFLYNEKLIEMELKPRPIGGYNYIVKIRIK